MSERSAIGDHIPAAGYAAFQGDNTQFPGTFRSSAHGQPTAAGNTARPFRGVISYRRGSRKSPWAPW